MHKSGSMSSEEEFPSHYIPRRYDPSAHARYTAFSQGTTEDWPLGQRNGERLDHLTGRRETYAAESGHLLSRHRPGGASGEWTSKGSLSDDQSIPLDNLPYRNPSPPRDPFANPIGTSLQQSDSLDAPSFQSFLDSDPTHTRCQSILFPDDQEVTEPQDIPQSFHDVGTSRYLKEPQVVRKVNSGFEILRPGTLDVPRQSNDVFDAKQEQGKSTNRPHKRLQKRNRSESLSENSARTEGAV